jgi:predicted lipase
MNTVKNSVQNYTAVFKKSKLIVTGHSLGAALATHAVGHLLHLGIKVDLFYNLGSPRVGDSKFHDWLSKLYGKFVGRIVHWKDPVPHLPFEAWGFQHLHNEVH